MNDVLLRIFESDHRHFTFRIAQISVADFPDTPAEELHLEQTPYSSGGWSGRIGRGLVNGEEVAVKIAQRYSNEAEVSLYSLCG